MEQFENPVGQIRSLIINRDVDTEYDVFFRFLRNEFMQNIPPNILTDESTLLKNIKDFYRAKGSEKAYKLLFRILFNEEVEFYYPGRDILRASDGRWTVDRSLQISLIQTAAIVGNEAQIIGSRSNTRARIERIEQYTANNVQIVELFVTHVQGTFEKNEKLISLTSNSELAIITSNGLITHSGRWDDTYGFLSSDKYLQDNYYYQEFSYEVRSSQTLQAYQSVAEKLVHPAGTKLFASLENEVSVDTDFGDIVTSLDYQLYPQLEITATVELIFGFAGGDGASYTYEVIVPLIPDIPVTVADSVDFNYFIYANTDIDILNSEDYTMWEEHELSVLGPLTISDFTNNTLVWGSNFLTTHNPGDVIRYKGQDDIVSIVLSDEYLKLRDPIIST